jgi:cell division protein YceG involved in septum cleavage
MGEGRHYFSSTLKEHNLAVDKFQKGIKGIKLPAAGQPE